MYVYIYIYIYVHMGEGGRRGNILIIGELVTRQHCSTLRKRRQ